MKCFDRSTCTIRCDVTLSGSIAHGKVNVNIWFHAAMISYHVVIGMRDTLYVAREIVPPINVAEFYPRTIHFASVPIEPTL